MIIIMTIPRIHGSYFEETALQHLKKQNLKLLRKNFNCKMGEIDLIMLEKEILVFIEVRYRQNPKYGSAIESISYFKQQKIKKAAQYFLLTHAEYQQHICRFDALAIDNKKISWIKNAFC